MITEKHLSLHQTLIAPNGTRYTVRGRNGDKIIFDCQRPGIRMEVVLPLRAVLFILNSPILTINTREMHK